MLSTNFTGVVEMKISAQIRTVQTEADDLKLASSLLMHKVLELQKRLTESTALSETADEHQHSQVQ
jgi:hypothetical protein